MDMMNDTLSKAKTIAPSLDLRNALRRRDGSIVVLAYVGGLHPFVTWRLAADGSTFLGHYFQREIPAYLDLLDRAKEGA